MADLPQELINAIEQVVDERFDELIKAHKLDPTAISLDPITFQEEQMLPLDGYEPITQGFFRKFMTWLSNYIGNLQFTDAQATIDSVKYVSPVDYETPPECGKLIAPMAQLVIEGEDVEPEIPDPADATPDQVAFNPAVNLMEGGLAYNKTDNKWYFRGGDTIYDLKDALALGIIDITGLTEALALLEPKQDGKSLSENDLTDALKAEYDGVVSHVNVENIHLPPDGISIQQSDDDALEVVVDYIIGLFSASLPLAIDANGNITLAIDDTTLEIVDGKLTVKAVAVDTKLSFDEETSILSVDAGGDASVDLSSLGGGGSVDLSNYVRKTGAATQTIEGDLKVTGEVEPFA